MLRILFILFLSLPGILSAQKQIDLKKKFFGAYEGQISAFELDGGKDLISVDSVTIRVVLTEKNIEITIGKQMNKGTYSVLFEGDKYIVLDCRMPEQLAGERIVVYKHGKKISREGLYPQPNTFLFRVKN
jgi:hypothetical protein